MLGAKAVAVVSSQDKFKMCEDLGAVGVINRKDFPNLDIRRMKLLKRPLHDLKK